MKKIVAFDLDDTLCTRISKKTGIEKYHDSVPNQKNIDICNACYDIGHYVVIYTARGMYHFNGRHNDIVDELYALTKQQLADWNVKHNRLVMGKVHYDLLIDDKVANINDINSINDVTRLLNDE